MGGFLRKPCCLMGNTFEVSLYPYNVPGSTGRWSHEAVFEFVTENYWWRKSFTDLPGRKSPLQKGINYGSVRRIGFYDDDENLYWSSAISALIEDKLCTFCLEESKEEKGITWKSECKKGKAKVFAIRLIVIEWWLVNTLCCSSKKQRARTCPDTLLLLHLACDSVRFMFLFLTFRCNLKFIKAP